ncbi:MAG TPA: hypothetical protein VGK46_10020 [Saprospiraceae bacterium]
MKPHIAFIVCTLTIPYLMAQNVGIGTTSPSEKLHVAGNVRVSGEIKPDGEAGLAGQVLTSNGNGTMQWAAMNSGTEEEGNGGWGDCGVQQITDFFPAGMSGAKQGDQFGQSVAISGDYAIVGAPYDDASAMDAGSATIYSYNATTESWEDQGKVFNPSAVASDQFGWSVSISGDYAIVGSFADDENGHTNTGSATIFKRNINTGVWESQGKLTNPSPAAHDNFGLAVSISGDYAIVGALNDDESGKTNCGSATVFKRNINTGVWESQGKLLNPNLENDDSFGTSVSISGVQAIVGAYLDDELGSTNVGSATIFKRNINTGVWESQIKFLEDGFTNDYFGISVSIHDDYAMIGISGSFAQKGMAVIYRRNTQSGIWEEQTRLTDPEGQEGDQLGSTVYITPDYAFAGSLTDDEDGIADSGSVTLFKKLTEGLWYVHEKFTCPHATPNAKFGAVAMTTDENRFVTGARGISQSRGMVIFGRVK